MFIVGLITEARKWEQPKCLPTDKKAKCGIFIQWSIIPQEKEMK